MTRRIVVVGGVAAGMSAASQARRRDPAAEVVVLERGEHVSYGACGMPYNILDPRRAIEDLVVVSAERFRRERGIDVRTGHQVLRVDATRRRVIAREGGSRDGYELTYDALVLATGARAVTPPIPGVDRRGVFVLRELAHGAALKRFVAEERPRRAVIVGAGYVGLEMAEALQALGLDVAVLEKLPQVVPGFEGEIAAEVRVELERRVSRVETGATVQAVHAGPGGGLSVATDSGDLPADLVLLCVGVRPEVTLAREAGAAVGTTGAIAVNDRMETDIAGVFAAGDCAEAHHRILGRPAWVPLGTTANKQGKVAGANAAGGSERFAGILGTAGFKVFDLEVARTGLSLAEAQGAGLEAVRATSRQQSRGHAYPGGSTLTTAVVAERETGRLLGAQMVGAGAVATRIGIFAAALHAGLAVDDVADLDLAYAPPFAPVYDPVLIAATVARKALARRAA